MFEFILAITLLLITPGPGVLTTAGVGSAYGYPTGLRFIVGLFIGTNLVALAVVSGLAASLESLPWLRLTLLIISAAYLGYLALKVAFAGSKIGFMSSSKAPTAWNAILLQLINPKAYAVNSTLFGGFNFMPDNLLLEVVIKFVLINLIWIPVHVLWLAAGVALKRMALTGKTQRAINIGMAIAMLTVIGMALFL